MNYYGSCINFSEVELQNVISFLYASKLLNKPETVNQKIIITDKGINNLPLHNKNKLEQYDLIKYDDSLDLYSSLKEIRRNTAKRYLQKPSLICPEEILKEISVKKPKDRNELLMIKGFTKRMFHKIGTDFIDEIINFKKNDGRKIKFSPGIKETYRLIKEGYSLNAISKIRKLSETVISMHAESIIENEPDIDIKQLLKDEFIKTIYHELSRGFSNLKELKERLPNEITYPIIRIAVAKFKTAVSLSSSSKK